MGDMLATSQAETAPIYRQLELPLLPAFADLIRPRVQLTHGLLIREPWVSHILDGRKVWEIRGCNTKRRGPIALIKSGSLTVVGWCLLDDVVGPLTSEDMLAASNRHGMPTAEIRQSGMPYRRTFAWVLSEPRRLPSAMPYRHPNGAIIWVRFDSSIQA